MIDRYLPIFVFCLFCQLLRLKQHSCGLILFIRVPTVYTEAYTEINSPPPPPPPPIHTHYFSLGHRGCITSGPRLQRAQLSQAFPFETMIALHASLKARNSTFLAFAFLVHSTLFLPKSSAGLSNVRVGHYRESDFCWRFDELCFAVL